MKMNDAGFAVLRSFEKLRLEAYDDATGKTIYDWSKVRGYPTIGWGHKITEKEPHLRKPITAELAEKIFEQDVAGAERVANAAIKGPVNSNQFSALVCFVYNVGGKVFNETDCTLLRMVNAGNFAAAALQFARWNKTTINGQKVVKDGLSRRRWAERKLFLTEPVSAAAAPAAEVKQA